MDNSIDYDRDGDREDILNKKEVKENLQDYLHKENDMMKNYLITAERIHGNKQLKDRLQNFSEGNAKRSKQLDDELNNI